MQNNDSHHDNDPHHDIEWIRSVLEIQQLCFRYAHSVDSRDIDTLVRLFVPDVRVGRDLTGRDALHSWYTRALRSVGATIHVVANHQIDDVSGTAAAGIVYCREEIEDIATGRWRIGMLQYWDTYQRVDGQWLFVRRRVRRWYPTAARTGPLGGGDVSGDTTGPSEDLLPESFPTWSTFWEN